MVYMYHSFLIHSSADGHLGCLHVLAIINSAVMNIGVHVSLSDLVSSVCMPRSVYEIFKVTLVYSQAEGQGPLRQAIMYDYNNKSNGKQVKETVSNMKSELAFSLQHFHVFTTTGKFQHHKDSSVCPFINIPISLPHSPHLPSLTLGHH